jgi:hypothetical protein
MRRGVVVKARDAEPAMESIPPGSPASLLRRAREPEDNPVETPDRSMTVVLGHERQPTPRGSADMPGIERAPQERITGVALSRSSSTEGLTCRAKRRSTNRRQGG